jgi:hypothetical protein
LVLLKRDFLPNYAADKSDICSPFNPNMRICGDLSGSRGDNLIPGPCKGRCAFKLIFRKRRRSSSAVAAAWAETIDNGSPAHLPRGAISLRYAAEHLVLFGEVQCIGMYLNQSARFLRKVANQVLICFIVSASSSEMDHSGVEQESRQPSTRAFGIPIA